MQVIHVLAASPMHLHGNPLRDDVVGQLQLCATQLSDTLIVNSIVSYWALLDIRFGERYAIHIDRYAHEQPTFLQLLSNR